MWEWGLSSSESEACFVLLLNFIKTIFWGVLTWFRHRPTHALRKQRDIYWWPWAYYHFCKSKSFLMGLVQHTKERIFSLHRVLRVLCNSDDLGLSQPTVSALIKQTSQLLRQCTNSFVSPPVSVKLWKNKLHLYKLWDQLCLKLPVAELYVWYMVGCCGVFPNTGWH